MRQMVPAAFMSRDAGHMVSPGPIGEPGEMTFKKAFFGNEAMNC